MHMRNVIHTVLGISAVVALVIGGAACSRSREANTPSSVQTPTPTAERVNPGPGYYGTAPENTNRPTTPSGIGGGPSGVDQSGAGMGTTGSQGTDSTGAGSMGGTDNSGMGTSGSDAGVGVGTGGSDATGGSDKGSGTTGGTQK